MVLKLWHKLVEITDFAMPIGAWQSARHVIGNILLASFLVNTLSLAFPLALLQVYDRIIPNVAITTLVLLIIGVGIALIIEAIMRVVRSYVSAWADARFEHVIGCDAFNYLIQSKLKDYEADGSGIHLKRINSLNLLRDYYAGQAIITIIDIPFVFIFLAIIYYIAGWLVLVPAAMLILFLGVAVVRARNFQSLLEDRHVQDDRRFNFLIETLSNIHTVKSITLEAQMLRRYERLQKTSSSHDYGISNQSSGSVLQGLLMSQGTLVLVAAFGSVLAINGMLTVGGLAACTLLSGRCLQPVNTIVQVWTRSQAIKIVRKELAKIFSLPKEETKGLPKLYVKKGEIEFRNVSFSYSPESAPTIKNLNLKINEHETIAIKGGGQSGKSTLLWLILGVVDPTEGSVLVDQQDLLQVQPHSIRQKIAYLPQQGVLFNGTIMENLTMFSGPEHYHAARKAVEQVGLSQVIERLPKGFDTILADQANETFPRGLKQRLCIARALVHKPKIILFDEANTAIDMQGDLILKNLLADLSKRTTMILISHRPSILELADRTYQLENGNLSLLT